MEVNVYLTNLAKYNEGSLVGEWLALPMDEDELQEKIASILGTDEEYFITDYEAPFNVEEYSNVNSLNELAERLENYDEDLITAIVNCTSYDIEEVLDIIDEGRYMAYYGVNSLEDVAGKMVDEGLFGEINDSIKCYIDYEAIARDLDIDGWNYDYKTNIAVRVD